MILLILIKVNEDKILIKPFSKSINLPP